MHKYTNKPDIVDAVNNRILPRLREISLCAKISQAMFNSNESFNNTTFELDSLKISVGSDHRALTDPILDTGITMVRVMVQFLGYTVSNQDLSLKPYSSKVDDITIESLNLPKPSKNPSDADFIFASLTQAEIDAVKKVTVKTNNGVAHLTINETRTIGLDELALACTSIQKIVQRVVLNPLGANSIKVYW